MRSALSRRLLSIVVAMSCAGALVLAASPVTQGAATPPPKPGSSLHITRGWAKTICCKKDARDFWSTERQCRLSEGSEVKAKRCHDADAKIKACCKKAERTWWSNRRDCRRSGVIVVDTLCRRT